MLRAVLDNQFCVLWLPMLRHIGPVNERDPLKHDMTLTVDNVRNSLREEFHACSLSAMNIGQSPSQSVPLL